MYASCLHIYATYSFSRDVLESGRYVHYKTRMGWDTWNFGNLSNLLRGNVAGLDEIFGTGCYSIEDMGSIRTDTLEVSISALDPRDGALYPLVRGLGLPEHLSEPQRLDTWLRFFGKEEPAPGFNAGDLGPEQVDDLLMRLKELPVRDLMDKSTLHECAVFVHGYSTAVDDYLYKKGYWTPDPLAEQFPYLADDIDLRGMT